LTRLDPVRELEEMTQRLNRLMTPSETVGGEALVKAEWAPVVDIQETDKEYLVKVELPEVMKDDLKVTIKDGVLSIEGERRLEKDEENKTFHRRERSYVKFMRSFHLPDDVDEKRVAANFKEGVLSVHVGPSR
jgi:HSP20 family protein